jgi:hypothetical protein
MVQSVLIDLGKGKHKKYEIKSCRCDIYSKKKKKKEQRYRRSETSRMSHVSRVSRVFFASVMLTTKSCVKSVLRSFGSTYTDDVSAHRHLKHTIKKEEDRYPSDQSFRTTLLLL